LTLTCQKREYVSYDFKQFAGRVSTESYIKSEFLVVEDIDDEERLLEANEALKANFSRLEIRFHLAREVGHYVMDYFMPSILLVAMSWVSFWLDPNAIPGRTTLGTSTMLTFITLTRNTGSALPKVKYFA
jgi:Neurotransmitter-gated ion-channel transmembrane region